MHIKKLFINGCLFLATVVVVYFAFMFVLVHVKVGNNSLVYRTSDVLSWKGGNSYRKFADFDSQHSYDVIVIGSSHAYRGYDPRIFKTSGKELFNLGTSGQSVYNSYFIAKNYITATNCKLVILELYDGALSSDAIEPSSDLIENINSDKAAFEMAIALKDPRTLNMFSVRLLNKSAPPMYEDSAYIYNGFSERQDSVKKVEKDWCNARPKVSPLQVNYLNKILSYFKANDIEVVLVSHPAPKELNNGNHQKFIPIIEEISKKYNVPYFDYSYSHNLELRYDFYDGHHLNQSGVEKFNKMVIQDLSRMHYF